MCRLYGLHANEETKVECSLVHAQNSLMSQSRQDLAGLSHGHGWGVATYPNGTPDVSKQAWAAFHGEHFAGAAARTYSRTVVAHVRRATVGPPKTENTHPFVYKSWAFAHNGTVPVFADIRPKMLEAMTGEQRAAVKGDTDSEHLFHYLMSLHEAAPARPVFDILRDGVRQVIDWCRALQPDAPIGLNVLLTDGNEFVGTRWGRTLHYVLRRGVRDCEICGFPHIHHDPKVDYRAAVVASEPITHEIWSEMPEQSAFRIDTDFALTVEPLGLRAAV
jgi:predicted glutamine amidotransferase